MSNNSRNTIVGRFGPQHNEHCRERLLAIDDWWMARIVEDRAEAVVPPPALRVGEAYDE
jgi:hypothetical protein